MRRTWKWVLAGLVAGAAPGPLWAVEPARPAYLGGPVPSSPLAVAPLTPGDAGEHCDPVAGPIGGASLYFLRPYLNNNPAFTTTVTTVTPGLVPTLTTSAFTTDFEWDSEPAYSAWVGFVSECGLGARARWFHFDHTANAIQTTPGAAPGTTITGPSIPRLPQLPGLRAAPLDPFGSPGLVQGLPGAPPDVLTFDSDLEIYSIDVEGLFALRSGRWSWLFSGGGRYLHLDQDYNATLTNAGPPGGPAETQQLTSSRNFNGFGPTAAVEGAVRLGRSNLSVFGGGRGSLLVGSSRHSAAFTQELTAPFGGVIRLSTDSTNDFTLPVMELELGMRYDLDLGRSRAFFRASVVNQTYFDAGSATQSDGNLSLYGAQFAVGLNF